MLGQRTTVAGAVSQIIFERVYDKETKSRIIVGARQRLYAVETPSKKPAGYQTTLFDLAKAFHAIQRLPGYLQVFGHYMYGPFCEEEKEQLFELVFAQTYSGVLHELDDRLSTVRRREIARGITRLLIEDHRLQSFGGESLYKASDNQGQYESIRSYSVGKLCTALKERFWVSIERKHWVREGEYIYNSVRNLLDMYERKALSSVAEAIRTEIAI